MASPKRTDHPNMQYGSSSPSRGTQPYFHETCNNNNAQVSEYPAKGHHKNKGNLEPFYGQIGALPTSAGDSVFQEGFSWNDDRGIRGLPNHSCDSGDNLMHGEVLVELEPFLPVLGLWKQTSDEPQVSGAVRTVSAGLMGNGSQSTMDSLQLPILDNPGNETFNSYLYNFLETEKNRLLVEEVEPANLSDTNTAPFEQSPVDSFNVNEIFAAHLNAGYDNSNILLLLAIVYF
jgi:hypothetical protein